MNDHDPQPTGVHDRDFRAAPQRVIPATVAEASRLSQQGILVDVSTIIPKRPDESKYSFQFEVQQIFDGIARRISSPEYAQFRTELMRLLTEVKGQDFLFDIEGTVISDFQNSDPPVTVYFANVWMTAVVETLLHNGNSVGFWTSATGSRLVAMKEAMSPEMAN